MTFSTKVTAGSSASPTPRSPCGTGTRFSGARSWVNSLILPLLLLAITSCSGIVRSVTEKSVDEPNRQFFPVPGRASRNIEGHQFTRRVLVLRNKVDGIAFLYSAKG